MIIAESDFWFKFVCAEIEMEIREQTTKINPTVFMAKTNFDYLKLDKKLLHKC